MISFFNRIFNKCFSIFFGHIIDYFVSKDRNKISLYYFNSVKNVGDILNIYLVEKISGRKVVRRQYGIYPHIVAVGSVMDQVNNNSYIWGTGFISPHHLPKSIDLNKIKAVRGEMTLKILKNCYGFENNNIPLGDPAVLLPLFFNYNIDKKYRLGVVPHYVDYDWVSSLVSGIEGVKIINVKQGPEGFIKDILECENIISSSLHGLVFSDAYNLPNKWVVFSDKLVGGEFKFQDYYSTTDNPDEKSIVIKNELEIKDFISNVNDTVSVKKFIYSKEKLLASFPCIENF